MKRELPASPGIYKFLNKEGEVLYVGKAKNLRSRVNSYFQNELDKASKTAALVRNIYDIEYIETVSELEALILEADLIKKFRPKYNIVLKDDKSYLYIVIRSEEIELNGQKLKLPKVLAVRATDLREGDLSFGPYPNTNTARYILLTVRRVFPFRDCSPGKFKRYSDLGRPCLYGHLGVCQAPCVGWIRPENYKKEVGRVKRLLSGESSKIIKEIERMMNREAKAQQFEKAAYYRDILEKFNYVRNRTYSPSAYIENPYLVQDLQDKSLEELKNNLGHLHKIPVRIECYDISNISGKDAVGSMVVAVNGAIQKSEYRKFKIRRRASPDDFDMMFEVLYRRLKREVSSAKNITKWGLPDLIVVDGGKGQVTSALKALTELNMDIPVIGLAKKKETIIYFFEGRFIEINLPGDNEGLRLLQRLRDEAHRFAQAYHHKLRLNRL